MAALIFGALIAAVAAICMNYGIFLSKREVDQLPMLGAHGTLKTIKAFVTSKPWLKAQGLQLLAGMLHVVAIGLAPLSIVEPIGAAGICFLVVLTVVYLGEKASWLDWVGIGVMVLGVALLGVSLVAPKHKFSYHPIVVWFFIILLIGVVIYSFYVAFTRRKEEISIFAGIGLGCLVGLNAILIKLAWNDVGHLWSTYHLGSLWRSPYALLAIIGSLAAQVLFQITLQRGKAMLIVPLQTGFSNMIPIVVGVLALKEPFPTEFNLIMLRLLAFLFIIGGAVLLSLQGEKDKPAETLTAA